MTRLPGKREVAAQLMAEGKTQADASRDGRVNVTKQTMNKWAHDPDFQRRVEELRSDPVETADELLIEDAITAVEVVKRVMRGDVEDPKLATTMLKAALYVLDLAKRKKLPPPTPRNGVGAPGTREKVEGLSDDEIDDLLTRQK